MSIDEKIISELKRYNDINRYIIEQDVPPAPEGEAALPPPPGVDPTLPPTPGGEVEVDVTDIVKDTKETKEAVNSGNQKVDELMNKLTDLETKLASMNDLVDIVVEGGSNAIIGQVGEQGIENFQNIIQNTKYLQLFV